jgi:hypothetical protein
MRLSLNITDYSWPVPQEDPCWDVHEGASDGARPLGVGHHH